MRWTTALAHQFDSPAWPRNPAHRQQLGRDTANPPASDRRRRRSKRIVTSAAPAPQHQRGRATVFRRQLKAAGSRHRSSSNLANNGGKAAMPQSFLHYRQYFFVPAALGVDYLTWWQAGLLQGGREQITARECPKNCAAILASPGCHSGRKKCCSRIIVKRAARSRQFMQCRRRQSAANKPFVHGCDAEREMVDCFGATRCLDCANPRAQALQAWH